MQKPFWPPWKTSRQTWAQPYHWKGHHLIFTCSLSDFFLPEADGWRPDAWKVIKETPQHTWQILTKRPELIASRLPPDWGTEGYPNVWLGTTVELQSPFVEERLPQLLQIPSRVRFVSAEPLLGPLNLQAYLGKGKVSWVIVGGESQKGARPMDMEWARQIKKDCEQAGAAFFLKQLGGYPNPRKHEEAVLDGETITEFPVDVSPEAET